MKKTVLIFGSISGLLAAVLMVLTALILRNSEDFAKGAVYGFTGIILSMLLIYFGIRSYRNQNAGGSISFGKAFSIGILIAIISSLFYVVSWMLVNHYLMPDFVDKYADYQLQLLKDAGATAQEIADKQASMNHYKEAMANPVKSAALVFTEPFPIGLIVAFISSLILKKKPAP